MKKSLIVLAALGAFAGVASAQSSVTLYGRVDLSVNKPVGSANKGISNGSGSRFGARGVEDLGGGMSAFFNIEHRFDADPARATTEVEDALRAMDFGERADELAHPTEVRVSRRPRMAVPTDRILVELHDGRIGREHGRTAARDDDSPTLTGAAT